MSSHILVFCSCGVPFQALWWFPPTRLVLRIVTFFSCPLLQFYGALIAAPFRGQKAFVFENRKSVSAFPFINLFIKESGTGNDHCLQTLRVMYVQGQRFGLFYTLNGVWN